MVRSVLQRLADLAADVEGVPYRPLPELDPYALADQLLVLTQELLSVADPVACDRARRLLSDLRQDL